MDAITSVVLHDECENGHSIMGSSIVGSTESDRIGDFELGRIVANESVELFDIAGAGDLGDRMRMKRGRSKKVGLTRTT
jgi:hypothetical protein